jgi:hypothetical protein
MSSLFLITVKLPKNPEHNPREKKTGPCPVNGKPCTDVTGEHHSFAVSGEFTVEELITKFTEKYGHVTRIEVM